MRDSEAKGPDPDFYGICIRICIVNTNPQILYNKLPLTIKNSAANSWKPLFNFGKNKNTEYKYSTCAGL